MSRKRILFQGNSALHQDLRRRVDAYFDETGLDRGANWGMWLKTATILTWFAATYAFYLAVPGPLWQTAALGVSAGLAMAGMGFSIQHDGGHKGYSQTKAWPNRSMALVLDFLGGSSYMWHWKHNVFHHTYPNVVGVDDDIAVSPLGRLAPAQPRYRLHRFQWIYMWVLYALLAFKWHFIDDFLALYKGELQGHAFPRPQGWDLFVFFAGKVVWATWMFAIPLLLLEWQHVLVFFVVLEAVLGLALATVFQLAHCVVGAESTELPGEGELLELDWAEHQLRTAVDFAPNNPLVTWYVGGLNFQAVHHLFPRVCHVHYPALSKIVAEVAAEHGVPYRVNPSFIGTFASHVRWLWQMGQPVDPPASGQGAVEHPQAAHGT